MADLKKYETIITNKLKQIIQKEGLVGTGKLLNSIQVKIDGNELSVISEDYYQYLDKKYNLSKQLFESQEVKDFISAYASNLVTTTLTSN